MPLHNHESRLYKQRDVLTSIKLVYFFVGPGECADDPCDRGTCERAGRNDFFCACPNGWSGYTCSDGKLVRQQSVCLPMSQKR